MQSARSGVRVCSYSFGSFAAMARNACFSQRTFEVQRTMSALGQKQTILSPTELRNQLGGVAAINSGQLRHCA